MRNFIYLLVIFVISWTYASTICSVKHHLVRIDASVNPWWGIWTECVWPYPESCLTVTSFGGVFARLSCTPVCHRPVFSPRGRFGDTCQSASSIHSEWNRIESWMHTYSASPSKHACTTATMTATVNNSYCLPPLSQVQTPTTQIKKVTNCFVVVTSQPS